MVELRGKQGVCSGLNNIDDISMAAEDADICGGTERELPYFFAPEAEALAKSNDTIYYECVIRLRGEYDG